MIEVPSYSLEPPRRNAPPGCLDVQISRELSGQAGGLNRKSTMWVEELGNNSKKEAEPAHPEQHGKLGCGRDTSRAKDV